MAEKTTEFIGHTPGSEHVVRRVIDRVYNLQDFVRIDIEAENAYESTANLEPHKRLGKITDFFYESLRGKGMSDKRKSEILALAMEIYRERLGLEHS